MDPKCWCVELNDGHFIPVLGFGPYAPEEVPRSKAVEVTKLAIDAWFQNINSAFMYNNDREAEWAIRSKIEDGTSVPPKDRFITKACTIKLGNQRQQETAGENAMMEINCLSPSWVPKSKAGEATKVAIDVGFHHIDSAYLYQNEE
ncbi:hypothetical protein HPG69_008429 [Diceros bicornis minor]|uniref:NADP-dependent oxidoreductase domain-containing protein n=1 Tax=Diceros bicornis minor TaxID=77932 RepID=A0A7J7FL17_DICBM|nr:hypothetical protein HPG69_008429 [Diceros bicornis minor]